LHIKVKGKLQVLKKESVKKEGREGLRERIKREEEEGRKRKGVRNRDRSSLDAFQSPLSLEGLQKCLLVESHKCGYT
jgi:hypothetical protein